jgi:hypothetical protein
MGGDTAAFFFVMALLGFIAWTVWLGAKRRQTQGQAQTDLQHRLLDKFSSPQEIGDFLQTEGGRRFLQGLTLERKPAGNRHAGKRILLALQIGTVVTLLGISTLSLGLIYPMHSQNEPHPAVIIGILVLAIGIGFLISAGISYRLSKAWGIFSDSNGRPVDS